MFILTLFLSKLATPYGSNVRKNRKYFRYQGRNPREKITTLTCERFFHVVYQLKQPLSCVEEREGGGVVRCILMTIITSFDCIDLVIVNNLIKLPPICDHFPWSKIYLFLSSVWLFAVSTNGTNFGVLMISFQCIMVWRVQIHGKLFLKHLRFVHLQASLTDLRPTLTSLLESKQDWDKKSTLSFW